MMNSLFSSFDPMGGIMMLNYWIMAIICLIPISTQIHMFSYRSNVILSKKLSQFLSGEILAAMNNKNKQGKTNMLIGMFIMILLINISGLLPYVFTFSAHMLFTLSLALPFWLSFIIFSSTNNTNHFLSHLVPLSTPLALSQFMVLIETASQIIRPITLSVRLSANMTAGHILMALCSNNIFMLNIVSSVLIILILLEIAVAFIQSYVFTILISMYMSEI
uniref:ATP synthase subunit a n=1 Tax=Hypsibius dujardini TaxID=232323 RepID=E7BBA9_HYPDU|nr:ATP synthase F0 subunit 6 [Hypsibius dujardini]CBY83890.1 ATPase subunit 6 [Hypsibius dujardini]